MLFVPLPFVVALLLCILLVQMKNRTDQPLASNLFSWLILVHAISSILVGIRWGYGVKTFLPVQSMLAVIWSTLSWLGFRSLTRDAPTLSKKDCLHLLPLSGLVFLIVFWPEPIDLFIITVYVFYSIALFRLAKLGPNGLNMVKMEVVGVVYKALQITALALLIFALVDLLISIDLRFLDGQFAVHVVTVANLSVILVLGYASSIAGSGRSQTQSIEKTEKSEVVTADADEQSVFAQVEELMKKKALYKDVDLNLAHLARKAGVPARKVSSAINRVKGKNVSQFVNEHRIDEACRLLTESDRSITELMFEAGFQTKSNFNREFSRVTGVSPKQWREQNS